MKTLKVVLAGQPNVGKSSLINALSNAKMRVGNFSGVTLEKAEATLQYKGYEIVMIDLPGTYSLHGYTMEERVCYDFLIHQDYDIILNVLDSTNLENNLILTLQLQNLEKTQVIALNMIDEAQKDGVLIDSSLLASLLNVNVCPVSSTQKQNLETLLDTLIVTYENNFNILNANNNKSKITESIETFPLSNTKQLNNKNLDSTIKNETLKTEATESKTDKNTINKIDFSHFSNAKNNILDSCDENNTAKSPSNQDSNYIANDKVILESNLNYKNDLLNHNDKKNTDSIKSYTNNFINSNDNTTFSEHNKTSTDIKSIHLNNNKHLNHSNLVSKDSIESSNFKESQSSKDFKNHISNTKLPNIIKWHNNKSINTVQNTGVTSTLAQSARLIANQVQTITKRRAKGSAKIDSILLHKIWSIPIFLFAMFVVFEISFVLGKYFQDLIESGVDWLASFAHDSITNEIIASLIGDGIIKGVGAVISFLPLIATLFLGLTLLEGSGYMARVAFMLDGLFFKFGLHGKSFIPLVMGFGCSVPAYMATRTLQNRRDKLLTLFIIGFMSCSARLPIYLLFVGAFFSIEYSGFILFLIYLCGFIIALILAKILRICVFRGDSEPFVMEMPRYRIPTLRVVWFSVWSKSYLFLRKAGTVILLGAVFVWALANFPKSTDIEEQYKKDIAMLETQNLEPQILETKQREYENKRLESQLEYSFAGRLGYYMEPIFSPLGFDWRLSVALVTGFSAKEMVVTTLGVLYALGDQAADNEVENQNLQTTLRQNIDTAAAVAFIFFIMLYIPCFAATIAFVNESGKKIYGLYLFIFTTIVAYIFAYIGHEVVRLLGY